MAKGDTNKHPNFSEALISAITNGVGNANDQPWKNIIIARELEVNESAVSQWRSGRTLPTHANIRALIKLFFGTQGAQNRFRQEYSEFLTNAGLTPSINKLDVEGLMYSRRDVWGILIKPVLKNVQTFLTDAGDMDGIAGFSYEHLSSWPTEKEFYIPVPDWFREWSLTPQHSGHKPYEINEPTDFSGSPILADLASYHPYEEIYTLVERYAEDYARYVHRTHAERLTPNLPYNKSKTGIRHWENIIPSGADERANLRIECFKTDYFTHRVMRRVMKDIRGRRRRMFSNISRFPVFDNMNLSYFTTSFGINLIVVTSDQDGRYFHMARLSNNMGNLNQRNRLNVSANEGMNLEDIDIITGQINYRLWVERALSEELGILESDMGDPPEKIIDDVLFLEFSMEMTNFEPFMSGVVFLNISSERLNILMNTNARDARREISELVKFPFTRAGIMDMLINSENASADFTTFSLNIMNMILEKNITDR
jgi:hypothetical protein